MNLQASLDRAALSGTRPRDINSNVLISVAGNLKTPLAYQTRIVSQVLDQTLRIVHMPDLYAAERVARQWAAGNYHATPGRYINFEESTADETRQTPA